MCGFVVVVLPCCVVNSISAICVYKDASAPVMTTLTGEAPNIVGVAVKLTEAGPPVATGPNTAEAGEKLLLRQKKMEY